MGRLLRASEERARSHVESHRDPENRAEAWALDSAFKVTDERPIQTGLLCNVI